MKILILLLSLISLSYAYDYKGEYPKVPENELTPGSLCADPDQYRYAERVPYCKRNVSSYTKKEIFQKYRRAGYRLNIRNRLNYKVDHFIPLCAGGSNNADNLWPQHVSVFTVTDPIEHFGCEKLKEGRISQDDLVALIRAVKFDLRKAPEALRFLKAL